MLKRLSKKYGPKASLYATKADYIGRPRLREKYLLKAYATTRPDDLQNKNLIAESLATFYIEEQPNSALGRHWLTQLKVDLANYPDDDAQEEMQQLEQTLIRAHHPIKKAASSDTAFAFFIAVTLILEPYKVITALTHL